MKRKEKVFHIAPAFIGLLAIIGVSALLLSSLFGHARVAFDLIAFVTGIVALVMGTFHSALITRQLHIIERSNDKLNETISAVEDLVKTDRRIARQVEEDAEFEQRIIRKLAKESRER